ncbi:leucine-rich repeat-containing protein 40-like [Sycon ciliatum]|uniref:leucine-rich repeat-containing protein 40-like n=1 Tax=Sycon ciliatum TaxID=27933 RepID=UPI0031F662CB
MGNHADWRSCVRAHFSLVLLLLLARSYGSSAAPVGQPCDFENGDTTGTYHLNCTAKLNKTVNNFVFPAGEARKMTKLDLSRVKLADTLINLRDDAIFYSLTVLVLQHCDLANVSGLFRHMTKLTSLDLSYNRLRTLPADLLPEPSSLKVLVLRQCDLADVSGLFRHMTKLTSLDLSYNRLRTLPPDLLPEPSSLKVLVLQHCDLANVSGLFRNMTKLTSL